jgi:hypothetical protein
MDDEIPDNENPDLGWPRNNRASNVREGLFVTDSELIRRLGVRAHRVPSGTSLEPQPAVEL